MRKLILALLLFPFLSMAQEYELATKVKNDEFTKSTIIRTDLVIPSKKENKTPFSIEAKEYTLLSMVYYKKPDESELMYIGFNKAIDLGCLSKHDGKMMILFEDGEILEIAQVSDTDCSDTPSAQFIITSRKVAESNDIGLIQSEIANNLEFFKNKKVTKVRVYGSKFYDEIELKPGTELVFAQMIEDIERKK